MEVNWSITLSSMKQRFSTKVHSSSCARRNGNLHIQNSLQLWHNNHAVSLHNKHNQSCRSANIHADIKTIVPCSYSRLQWTLYINNQEADWSQKNKRLIVANMLQCNIVAYNTELLHLENY